MMILKHRRRVRRSLVTAPLRRRVKVRRELRQPLRVDRRHVPHVLLSRPNSRGVDDHRGPSPEQYAPRVNEQGRAAFLRADAEER